MIQHRLWTFFKYLSLLIATCIVFFPIYTVFVGAFKTMVEYYQNPLGLPKTFFNFSNFVTVIDRGRLIMSFGNTLFILVIALSGNILLGTMVSYALGRFDFKLKKVIMGMYLFSAVIPLVTTQVATFSVIKHLHLFDTRFAPILLYWGADVLQIIIYLQFISSIPYDLDESAMIEGASLFRIYWNIIFPLLGPATATVLILKTIYIYNDFYIPFLYMPDRNLQVVSTALYAFVGPNAAHLEIISAGILLIFIPTVLVYLFLQKYIFSGVTSGAVK